MRPEPKALDSSISALPFILIPSLSHTPGCKGTARTGANKPTIKRWGCGRDSTADGLVYITRDDDPHSRLSVM